MRSRPASQLADDGEAVGTPVPAAYDPSSAEPPVTDGGARKSVAPAPDGREANVSQNRWIDRLVSIPAEASRAHTHSAAVGLQEHRTCS